jgi:putative transposase
VIEVLSRLVSELGAPAFLRSDNGQEFVSKTILSWIVEQGISTALIEPEWRHRECQWQFRDECLSLEWFRSWAEAKDHHRGHSSLGCLTPNEFVAQCITAAPHHATRCGI